MFDYFFAALIGMIILAVMIGGPARTHITPAPRQRRTKKVAARHRLNPVLRRASDRPA